jgi:hypothetical protein
MVRTKWTNKEFLRMLGDLESSSSKPERRRALRSALDIETMNRFASYAEADIAYELTARLLHAAYGPELADLKQPDVMNHAKGVIENCRSTQLAKMLAASARAHGEHQVMSAVVNRWTDGNEAGAVFPATKNGRPRRRPPSRRARRDIAIRVIAVAGVLGVVFLLGFLLGRPDVAQAGSGTDEPRPTSSAAAPGTGEPKPKSSSLPVVGTVEMNKPTSQEVFSFVKLDAAFYPQSLCTVVDGITWQCARTSSPPDQPGVVPELKAVAVPAGQVPELQTLASQGRSTQKGADWGTPVTVEHK